MSTRRAWLFKNPPPATSENFEARLAEAKNELRSSMSETNAIVMEIFAAQAVKPVKKMGFLERRREEKKLLKAAKELASIIKYPDDLGLGNMEKRSDEFLSLLDKFQTASSHELVHSLKDVRSWRQQIAFYKERMDKSAVCSLDGSHLRRVANRKEDLFICTAPIVEDRPQHYFLWTLIPNDTGEKVPGFRVVDLQYPLPGIDDPMEE